MILRPTASVDEIMLEIKICKSLSRLTNQNLLAGAVICGLICLLGHPGAHTVKRTMNLDLVLHLLGFPMKPKIWFTDFGGGCLASCSFWQFTHQL